MPTLPVYQSQQQYSPESASVSVDPRSAGNSSRQLIASGRAVGTFANNIQKIQDTWHRAEVATNYTVSKNQFKSELNQIVTDAANDKDWRNRQKHIDKLSELKANQPQMGDELVQKTFDSESNLLAENAQRKVESFSKSRMVEHMRAAIEPEHEDNKDKYLNMDENIGALTTQEKRAAKYQDQESYDAMINNRVNLARQQVKEDATETMQTHLENGFITEEEFQDKVKEMDGWEADRARNDVISNPQHVIDNIDSYTLDDKDKRDVLTLAYATKQHDAEIQESAKLEVQAETEDELKDQVLSITDGSMTSAELVELSNDLDNKLLSGEISPRFASYSQRVLQNHMNTKAQEERQANEAQREFNNQIKEAVTAEQKKRKIAQDAKDAVAKEAEKKFQEKKEFERDLINGASSGRMLMGLERILNQSEYSNRRNQLKKIESLRNSVLDDKNLTYKEKKARLSQITSYISKKQSKLETGLSKSNDDGFKEYFNTAKKMYNFSDDEAYYVIGTLSNRTLGLNLSKKDMEKEFIKASIATGGGSFALLNSMDQDLKMIYPDDTVRVERVDTGEYVITREFTVNGESKKQIFYKDEWNAKREEIMNSSDKKEEDLNILNSMIKELSALKPNDTFKIKTILVGERYENVVIQEYELNGRMEEGVYFPENWHITGKRLRGEKKKKQLDKQIQESMPVDGVRKG